MGTDRYHQARRYQLLADEAYERLANEHGGKLPSLEVVAGGFDLPPDDLATREFQFKMTLVRATDKRKLEKGRSAQLDLFSGDPEALDGFMALGDGRRVRVRVAGAVEWVANLSLQAENVKDVMNTYQASLGQHTLIAPYLAQGMTTEDAVVAYLRDHQPKAS